MHYIILLSHALSDSQPILANYALLYKRRAVPLFLSVSSSSLSPRPGLCAVAIASYIYIYIVDKTNNYHRTSLDL